MAERIKGTGVAPGGEARTMKPGDEAPPGTPGTGEDVCPNCQGKGMVNHRRCPTCSGTGVVVKGLAGG
jgi:DnaJ-class molecular chaperone